MDEPLAAHLERLERERQNADRRYNDALTAVDQALPTGVPAPSPTPPADAEQLAALNDAWRIIAADPPIDRSLKGRLRGLVWRLVGPILGNQQRFNSLLVDHLNRTSGALEAARTAGDARAAALHAQIDALVHFQSRLLQYLQTITWYVDTKDRATAARADVVNAGLSALTDDWLKRWESAHTADAHRAATADRLRASIDDVRATAAQAQDAALALKRDVERLLAGPAPDVSPSTPPPAPDLDAFKYVGFENAFRGPTDEIARRLESYLPTFEGQSDVLDIGCGRGEFLDLLRAHGISARGLDSNHAMAEACRARGLDVVEADALTYLRGLDDGALGGLFAAQVVEHLPPAYLTALLETAAHKLRPGAPIVLETINPACWVAFFESYIRDLTHVRPLHPETLQYFLRASGFRDVTIAYRSPVDPAGQLRDVAPPAPDTPPLLADLIDTFNENVATLNGRMFTYMDYAAIGRR
ncbi:MAG TPA: class I SAM-dependent methyltransferase [Vicinamibacterales bacterium]|nr:class I SAM-dependent methyltransferase [Vicinamibacterales bacterium]